MQNYRISRPVTTSTTVHFVAPEEPRDNKTWQLDSTGATQKKCGLSNGIAQELIYSSIA